MLNEHELLRVVTENAEAANLPLKGGDYPHLFTNRASRRQVHRGKPPRFLNTRFLAPIITPPAARGAGR